MKTQKNKTDTTVVRCWKSLKLFHQGVCLCQSCGICMNGEHAHYSRKHYKIFIKLHSINICWVLNRLGFINGHGRMAPQGCLKDRFKASHSTLFHENEWNLLKMCITLGVRSSFQQEVSNFEFCGQFWAILAILYFSFCPRVLIWSLGY